MALAQPQIAASPERRRSERKPMALPLIVRGVSLDSKSFQEETFTLSVSAHGALLALATTVTLGQTLFLRNPQTQEEAGAWVTRFGLPRAGLARVGIEFVRPDAIFWSNLSPAKPFMDGAERRAEEEIHVLPQPAQQGASEPASSAGRGAAPHGQASPDTDLPAKLVSTEVLLHALEATLRKAAERAVAAAAASHLTASLNQAAAAIENFSQMRVHQFEERFLQYRQELATAAREEFLSQVQPDISRIEEHLRNRAGEFIDEVARRSHDEFAQRLRDTSDQAAAQFVEQAGAASARHFDHLSGQVQDAAGRAHAQVETAAAAFNQSHEQVKAEMERLVAETRREVESQTSQIKQANADGEAALRTLQEELTNSKEQEVERFRERLRNILTSLLSSLG